MNSDKLIFYERPTIKFANNIFTNVPTILQFDNRPIIDVKKALIRKYYIHTQIFHKDGTDLGVCDSLHLFLTKEGKKTNLRILRPQEDVAVCTLDGRTVLEMRRNGPYAVDIQAELYTPTGCLIKSNEEGFPLTMSQDQVLIGSNVINGYAFDGGDIGVWCRSDGNIDLGCHVGEVRQRA